MGRVTIEDAITAYREELAADRSLGDDTLDELTEHLRTAIDDRIAAGDDEATAIATARRQLGEPRALARECARVRSSVGPRASYIRAWGAAALIPLWMYLCRKSLLPYDTDALTCAYYTCCAVAIVALVARLPHATAFVFGVAIAFVCDRVTPLLCWSPDGVWHPEFRHVDIPVAIVEAAVLVVLGWGYRPSRAAKALVGVGVVCAVEWNMSDLVGSPRFMNIPRETAYDAFVTAVLPTVIVLAFIATVFRIRAASWLAGAVAVLIAVGLVGQTVNTDKWSWWMGTNTGQLAIQLVALAGAMVAAVCATRTPRPFRVALDDLRAGFA